MEVAVIEDNQIHFDHIKDCINNYAEKNNMEINIHYYSSASSFVFAYKESVDAIFMDIELPGINGLEGIEVIRKMDKEVPVVFVTSLKQYALDAYHLKPKAYLVKPYTEEEFIFVFEKVLNEINLKKGSFLHVNNKDGYKKISLDSIYYISTYQHYVEFHTDDGIIKEYHQNLNEVEERLPKELFVKCNSGIIVNLKYVTKVIGEDVVVGNEMLKISRPKKKGFMLSLHQFMMRNSL